MRARYYSPEMRRFVNADIIHGEISDSTSLNRYSFVNGNPVSFVDPFGLWSLKSAFDSACSWIEKNSDKIAKVAVCVVTVVALAAVTVATAGTATAVIAGGALIGATVSGTIGAVNGYATGGIDGAINGMYVGTISGAASGALGASAASATAVAVGNIGINIGETYLDDYVDDGKINSTDGLDIAFSVGSGVVGNVPGLQNSKHSSYFTNKMYHSALNNDMLDYSSHLVKSEIDGKLQDGFYATGRDILKNSINYNYRRCK